MATPEWHLKMSMKYYTRALSDFEAAKFYEELEDKACYFASSAEFLLLALDHLLSWFTRSDEFTSRISRWKSLQSHGKFRRLDSVKQKEIIKFGREVELIRNKLLYLHKTPSSDINFLSLIKLKPLLERYKNVEKIIRGLRRKNYK
ncbi:MAG: hypothetical protein ACE5J9_03015 [Methanosarcinales archaeon]